MPGLAAIPSLKTVDVPGVTILTPGRHNGRVYTAAELQEMVTAFTALDHTGALRAPVKLGHADDQTLLQSDGLPAAGWVSRLYLQGNRLMADLAAVPAKVAQLIKAGGYRTRSCEIFFGQTFAGKVWPVALKALSLLGEDTPAVESLDDIVALYEAHPEMPVTVATVTFAKARATMPRRQNLATGPSRTAERAAVQAALETTYPEGGDVDGPSAVIVELYADTVVVADQDGDAYFEIPYTYDGTSAATLGVPSPVEMRPTPTTPEAPEPPGADDTEPLPTSPDAQGGEMPGQGATPDGTQMARLAKPVDSAVAQLVNQANRDFDALLDKLNTIAGGQPGVSEMRSLLVAAKKALSRMKVAQPPAARNSRAESGTEDDEVTTAAVKSALKLAADASENDVLAAVIGLTAGRVDLARHQALEAEVAELKRKETRREAEASVALALQLGKIDAKAETRAWALGMAEQQPEAWQQYLSITPRHARVDLTIRGGEAGPEQPLDDLTLQYARRLGVSEESLNDTRPFDQKYREALAAQPTK